MPLPRSVHLNGTGRKRIDSPAPAVEALAPKVFVMGIKTMLASSADVDEVLDKLDFEVVADDVGTEVELWLSFIIDVVSTTDFVPLDGSEVEDGDSIAGLSVELDVMSGAGSDVLVAILLSGSSEEEV